MLPGIEPVTICDQFLTLPDRWIGKGEEYQSTRLSEVEFRYQMVRSDVLFF